MPRVKGGYTTRRRRKAILKLAKGYFGSKHTLYKTAHEQVMRSLAYAYRDRKQRKRNFRKLWITRINAACKLNGMKYSRFINGLNLAGIEVNRKMLADMAVHEPKNFADLVAVAQKALNGETAAPAKKAAAPAKKVEAKVEAPKADAVNLESLTVAELREKAKEAGITGYSAMRKAELIEALQ